MKKVLILLASLLLTASMGLFLSCGSHSEHQFGEWVKTETHHYRECTISGCTEKNFYGEHVFNNGPCSICKYVESSDKTADANSLASLLANAKDGATITLSPGTYSAGYISSKKNLTLLGQKGVIFEDNIKIFSNCENITIEGITFNKPVPENHNNSMEEGGVRIIDSVNGLTIKNCTFTNFSNLRVVLDESNPQVIKDLTLDGCTFEEVSNGKSLSSIYLGCTLENVTINNCLFDTIEYDAAQLSGLVKGNVTLTNSTYKNIGARCFNVNNAPDVNWNISYNKFYLPMNTVSAYFFKGSLQLGTKFNIGVNYWDTIPTLDTDYFGLYDSVNSTKENPIYVTDGIIYDEEAQLPIEE